MPRSTLARSLAIMSVVSFLSSTFSFTSQSALATRLSQCQHRQKDGADVTVQLSALKIGKNYVPKWKKKETLSEKDGVQRDAKDVGLIGSVSVVFKMGNETKSTMALAGQPLTDVATQAGQFIKYGCGKGECGTCESLVNGQYIRPCMAVVPSDIPQGEDYVIQVKEVKNKAKSSGKFYSVRSFLFGFYNNVLGMFAFVKTRRYARKNYEERMDYEATLARKIAEKKKAQEAGTKVEQN